jgi:hypothetical protein
MFRFRDVATVSRALGYERTQLARAPAEDALYFTQKFR